MGTLTKEQATVEKLLPEIRATHKAFLLSGKETVELARQIGDYLWKLKECVKHGEWQSIVEDRCEFTMRTAQTYMKLAGGWELLEKKEAAATTIDGCVKLIGQATPKKRVTQKRSGVRISTKSGGKSGSHQQTSAPQADAANPDGPCPHGGEHDYDDEACKRCHDPKPGVSVEPEPEEATAAGKLFTKIFDHLGKVTRLLDDLKKAVPNSKYFDDVFASLECANQDLHKWRRAKK
jgi:hypothetical protein